MNNTSSKILGLFLIFMGVGYFGNQFDLWSFTIFFKGWWACLFIIAGILSMIDSGFRTGNIIVTGLGVYFFLAINNFISYRITFQVVVAAILIFIGFRLLFFNEKRSCFTSSSGFDETKKGKRLYVHSSFSTRRVVNEEVLENGRVENICGTIFLDLQNADLKNLDVLSLENIFGTIEVIVPHDVNLNVKRENVFGSCYVDATHTNDGYVINIKETCVFGTIRISKAKK